jgi:hypothetical protein
VKLTWRTAKNKKRAAVVKVRKGAAAKTLPKGSKKIVAQAKATKKLRIGAKTPIPVYAPPPVVTPPTGPTPAEPPPTVTAPPSPPSQEPPQVGTAVVTAGMAATVTAPGGYALQIPAGALTATSTVQVTPLPPLPGGLNGASFHIDGPWTGTVTVTLPLTGDGPNPVVLHQAADGLRISSGAAVSMSQSNGVTMASAQLTSLSDVYAVALNCDDLTDPSRVLVCPNHADVELTGLLEDEGTRAGQAVEYVAGLVSDCPNNYALMPSEGDLPKKVTCDEKLVGSTGTWTFTNDNSASYLGGVYTAGAVYTMPVSGTFKRSVQRPPDLPILYWPIIDRFSNHYLFPNQRTSISKTSSDDLTTVGLSADPGITPLWASLGFLMDMLGSDLIDALTKSDEIRMVAKIEACVPAGGSPSLTASTVNCVKTALIEGLRYYAKHLATDVDMAAISSLLSQLMSFGDIAMIGESFWRVVKDKIDSGMENHIRLQVLPPDMAGIDPPSHPRTAATYLARDPETGRAVLVDGTGAWVIRDEDFDCLARTRAVWDIPNLKALVGGTNGTKLSCYSAGPDWVVAPARDGGNVGTDIILRTPDGHHWLVNGAGQLQPVLPGTYLCLARQYPVIWNTPQTSIDVWTPSTSTPALCSFDSLPVIGPKPFSRSLSDTGYDDWSVVATASNGWWLFSGTDSLSHQTVYKWVGPDGRDGPTWKSAYAPGVPAPRTPAVAGPKGEVFMVGARSDPFPLVLFKVGANGFEGSLDVGYNPGNPWGANVAMGRDGNLYWQANYPNGQMWVLRIDPDTLAITGRIEVGADALQSTQPGILVMTSGGNSALIPYGAFATQSGQAWSEWREPPLTDEWQRLSVGHDGAVAAVSYESRPGYACADFDTGYLSAGGTAWRKNVGDLVGLPLTNCLAVDIDARPTGGVVYTLKGDQGTYLLEVSASGEREDWTRLDDAGANVSTMIDDTGLVVTSFTRPLTCPSDPPEDGCSEVVLLARRSGAQVLREAWAGPEQTSKPYIGLVGQSQMYLAGGQVGMFIQNSPSNPCGSLDNCGVSGGGISFRTKVLEVSLPAKPANAWW